MDLKIIEEQLKKVPEEIKKKFFSIETARKIQVIGENNGLNLDQINTLIEETGLTMLGIKSSEDFTKSVARSLNISKESSLSIIAEINDSVLSVIKTEVREQLDSKQRLNEYSGLKSSSISNIEKVGGFSIEKDRTATEPKVTSADREKILDHLENPPTQPATYPKSNSPENHTEPLVDHLLQNSVGQLAPKPHHEAPAPGNLPVVEETPLKAPITQVPIQPAQAPVPTQLKPTATPEIPKTPPTPPKKSGPDPYREMVG